LKTRRIKCSRELNTLKTNNERLKFDSDNAVNYRRLSLSDKLTTKTEKINYYNCRDRKYIPFSYFKCNYKTEANNTNAGNDNREAAEISKSAHLIEKAVKTDMECSLDTTEEEKAKNTGNHNTNNNFWGSLIQVLIDSGCTITVEHNDQPICNVNPNRCNLDCNSSEEDDAENK